jgi:hypothetical protein
MKDKSPKKPSKKFSSDFLPKYVNRHNRKQWINRSRGNNESTQTPVADVPAIQR